MSGRRDNPPPFRRSRAARNAHRNRKAKRQRADGHFQGGVAMLHAASVLPEMARYEFANSHGTSLDRYYASSAWATRRGAYLARFGRCCEACGSTDRIDVHHADYRNLYEESDEDLVALCRSCHAECHHLRAEFRWQLQEMTRKFLDYRKRQIEHADLRATNDELRRRQDELVGRRLNVPPTPALELRVQEPITVARREARLGWVPPQSSAQAGKCVVCGGGDPGLGRCDACERSVHVQCGRHRRALICSVECSIEWMEAFGHA